MVPSLAGMTSNYSNTDTIVSYHKTNIFNNTNVTLSRWRKGRNLRRDGNDNCKSRLSRLMSPGGSTYITSLHYWMSSLAVNGADSNLTPPTSPSLN